MGLFLLQLVTIEQRSSESGLNVADSFILRDLSSCSSGRPFRYRTSNSSLVVNPFLVLEDCQLDFSKTIESSLRAFSNCSQCQCWNVKCWLRNLRVSLWLRYARLKVLNIVSTETCSSSSMLGSCEIRTNRALQVGDWSAGRRPTLSRAVGGGHGAV